MSLLFIYLCLYSRGRRSREMAAASHPSPTPLLASFHFLLMFVIYSGRNLGAFLIKNRARNTAQIGK